MVAEDTDIQKKIKMEPKNSCIIFLDENAIRIAALYMFDRCACSLDTQDVWIDLREAITKPSLLIGEKA